MCVIENLHPDQLRTDPPYWQRKYLINTTVTMLPTKEQGCPVMVGIRAAKTPRDTNTRNCERHGRNTNCQNPPGTRTLVIVSVMVGIRTAKTPRDTNTRNCERHGRNTNCQNPLGTRTLVNVSVVVGIRTVKTPWGHEHS